MGELGPQISQPLHVISRPPSAAPATGSIKQHTDEQTALVASALNLEMRPWLTPENARSTRWHNGIGKPIRGEVMSPPTASAADELRDQLLDAAEGVF